MTDESIDPIETLRKFIRNTDGARSYLLSMGEAKAIIATVERLQRIAGAVSDGPSFADLKKLKGVQDT